jgi:hypothetical protein
MQLRLQFPHPLLQVACKHFVSRVLARGGEARRLLLRFLSSTIVGARHEMGKRCRGEHIFGCHFLYSVVIFLFSSFFFPSWEPNTTHCTCPPRRFGATQLRRTNRRSNKHFVAASGCSLCCVLPFVANLVAFVETFMSHGSCSNAFDEFRGFQVVEIICDNSRFVVSFMCVSAPADAERESIQRPSPKLGF